MKKGIRICFVVFCCVFSLLFTDSFLTGQSNWSEWYSITDTVGRAKSCLVYTVASSDRDTSGMYNVSLKFRNICNCALDVKGYAYFKDSNNKDVHVTIWGIFEPNKNSMPNPGYYSTNRPHKVIITREDLVDNKCHLDEPAQTKDKGGSGFDGSTFKGWAQNKSYSYQVYFSIKLVGKR